MRRRNFIFVRSIGFVIQMCPPQLAETNALDNQEKDINNKISFYCWTATSNRNAIRCFDSEPSQWSLTAVKKLRKEISGESILLAVAFTTYIPDGVREIMCTMKNTSWIKQQEELERRSRPKRLNPIQVVSNWRNSNTLTTRASIESSNSILFWIIKGYK